MSLVPSVYRAPYGLPLNWRDEQSGRLPTAVMAFLHNRLEGTPLSATDLELTRAYCEHYINAPCWQPAAIDASGDTDLDKARRDIASVTTPDQLSAWIQDCLEIGIDPL